MDEMGGSGLPVGVVMGKGPLTSQHGQQDAGETLQFSGPSQATSSTRSLP